MRPDPVDASPPGRPLLVEVDLVPGRGRDFWPRPGRVFAASSAHTFAQLAAAVDVAFARLDLTTCGCSCCPAGST